MSIVQQVVGQIPWGHNVRLLDLVKNSEERLWYIRQVNDSAARRSMGITARLTHHPTTGVPFAIVDIAHRQRMDDAGVTTWDAKGYVILWSPN